MHLFRPLLIAYFIMPVLALTATAVGQFELDEKIKAKIQQAIPEQSGNAAIKKRKVLLFSKTNGFRHSSIPVGVMAIKMLGEQTGAFESVHSEDDSVFEPETLNQFDAVIMVNTTGDLFQPKNLASLDPAKKQAALQREQKLKNSLVSFVKSGKGIAGVHSATDTYKKWDDYNDMMGGAFDGHPWHMKVPVRLLDSEHPLNRVFGGKGFTIADEIYQFRPDTANPEDRRMLLSLDPEWSEIKRGKRADQFYAISWINQYGQGRAFYCSLGHRDEIYYNPLILEHYLAGIQYVLGDLQADDTPQKITNQ